VGNGYFSQLIKIKTIYHSVIVLTAKLNVLKYRNGDNKMAILVPNNMPTTHQYDIIYYYIITSKKYPSDEAVKCQQTI